VWKLNHLPLVESANVPGNIGRCCSCPDNVRKPRPIGNAGNSADTLSQKFAQLRKPRKQAGFKDASERAETLFKKMHLVLDDETWEWVVK
jgi:hypothetical protein